MILVALFAMFMMACIIAIVVAMVAAPDWAWIDTEVPVRRSVFAFLLLLSIAGDMSPLLGGLCLLAAIGFGLRRPVRLLFKLDDPSQETA